MFLPVPLYSDRRNQLVTFVRLLRHRNRLRTPVNQTRYFVSVLRCDEANSDAVLELTSSSMIGDSISFATRWSHFTFSLFVFIASSFESEAKNIKLYEH